MTSLPASKFQASDHFPGYDMLPAMQLVIVESPTKAKKLRSYLGKEYKVEASVGHVRDLPKSGLGVDVEKDFKPTYEVSEDKVKVIKKLKEEAKGVKAIILATDPDREGEAIAWHLRTVLSDEKIKAPFVRATFHEVTKKAVEEAIAKPSALNMHLVDAQQARRVVDRLVGYETSPVLWRKVRRGLSAGRVQSVALRLIVEREKEIEAFKPQEYWEIDVAVSTHEGKPSSIFTEGKVPQQPPAGHLILRVFKVAHKKYEPTTKGDVTPLVEWLPSAEYVVENLEKKERTQSSLPPFTTSTLQQAAANRLGMTSRQSMRLAQQLYEEGVITYHRTDSVNLAASAVEEARAFISKEFGNDYVPEKPRYFASNSKNAQEAHEAIRVTEPFRTSILNEKGLTAQHQKLYDLIRRRFLASQMAAAVYDQATVTVEATKGGHQALMRTTGSVLKFAGWRKLFPAGEDVVLPDVEVGQKLDYRDLNAAQKFTEPPPRYNDASLVKELEKRGIGRPSTYASIISVIIDRAYVERLDRRFKPTVIGVTVSDFLQSHFHVFMDYDFTAEMEEDLDRIARGEKEWEKVVKTFYGPFHKTVDETIEHAERVKLPVEKTGRMCPECGEAEKGELVIRTGRFGKFISCSRFPECKYTEKIVEKVGEYKCPKCKEGDVLVRKSRWGKPFYGCSRYPECDWATWKKPGVEGWDDLTPKPAGKRGSTKGSAKTRRVVKTTTKTGSKKTTKTTKKTATVVKKSSPKK